jgi:arsenate reductase-like glutaredoxin family protein
MTVTIWHNPKCAASRKVLETIRKKGTRLCRPPERVQETL